jgi:GNAT superfamily N-acetyltransferase
MTMRAGKGTLFDVRLAANDAELAGILELQRANLAPALSAEEVASQGFVTATHSLEILRRMHALAPSVLAVSGGRVIGYALVMLREARAEVPVLAPFFRILDDLEWRGQRLCARAFYVMGQVCVARDFRGQGVFDALYAGHREHYAERFDAIVTEVATRNTRSLRAHARVGFETALTYRDATDEWAVLAWDFSRV